MIKGLFLLIIGAALLALSYQYCIKLQKISDDIGNTQQSSSINASVKNYAK